MREERAMLKQLLRDAGNVSKVATVIGYLASYTTFCAPNDPAMQRESATPDCSSSSASSSATP